MSRNEAQTRMVQSGYSGEIIRQVNGLDEYDLFDVLIEIAYGKAKELIHETKLRLFAA